MSDDSRTQLGMLVDREVVETWKDVVRLQNNGKSRGIQGEELAEAMKLQMAQYFITKPYQLDRVKNEKLDFLESDSEYHSDIGDRIEGYIRDVREELVEVSNEIDVDEMCMDSELEEGLDSPLQAFSATFGDLVNSYEEVEDLVQQSDFDAATKFIRNEYGFDDLRGQMLLGYVESEKMQDL